MHSAFPISKLMISTNTFPVILSFMKMLKFNNHNILAMSAGIVEYTNCFSAEG